MIPLTLRSSLSSCLLSGSLLLTLVLSGVVTPAVAADDEEASPHYLDEVVVTGTRSARTVSDTPVRTEVVTRRELEKTHARSVADALEDVPGLLLRNIHGKAGQEVWLQGINADRVLVLIDGMPMTATTGSSVDVSQLAILDVERIEVVKGAVSAQYGSAAMGGVINVITRQVEPGLAGELTMDVGSYGDQNPSGDHWDVGRHSLRGGVDLGNDQWRLRVSGSSQESDGIDPEPDTWQRPGDEYERNQFNSRLTWLPQAGQEVFAEVGGFEEQAASRFVQARPGGLTENHIKDESVERVRLGSGGHHQLSERQQLHWNLLHETLTDDTEKSDAASRYDFRSADLTLSQLSAHTELAATGFHTLMVGADYRHESLEQTKDGVSELFGDDRASRSSRELWLQDTWMPSDRWEWVVGLRGQYDSDFGDHFAPKLNLRYDLAPGSDVNHYIRASWGGGYRVPNLKERHYLFDHSQLGYVVVGQPDLRPESSESVQLGWGINVRQQGWLEVNAFLNNIEDLIQTEFDAMATTERGDGVAVYTYRNVAKARTRGIETTAGWQLAPGWELTAGYTYTEAEDRSGGVDLTRRPEHQGRVALDGRTGIPGMSWSTRIRSQSSEVVDASFGRTSPGFTTVDLKLNQRLGDNLKLFAGVDNLTDRQRDFDNQNDFGPVAGRFIYGGLTLKFAR